MIASEEHIKYFDKNEPIQFSSTYQTSRVIENEPVSLKYLVE